MSWSTAANAANVVILHVQPRLAPSDALRLACKVIADPRAAAVAQATSGVMPCMRLTA
jgi:hypothetical protein